MEDYFTKCDEWLTGITSLDAQHAELAASIREIENICLQNEGTQPGNSLPGYKRLPALLENLYQATKKHFEYEDAAMLKTSYPDHSNHRLEHNLMLAELKLVIRDQASGEKELDAEMARGLKIWFIAHVNLSDCKFSAYIADQGVVME